MQKEMYLVKCTNLAIIIHLFQLQWFKCCNVATQQKFLGTIPGWPRAFLCRDSMLSEWTLSSWSNFLPQNNYMHATAINDFKLHTCISLCGCVSLYYNKLATASCPFTTWICSTPLTTPWTSCYMLNRFEISVAL